MEEKKNHQWYSLQKLIKEKSKKEKENEIQRQPY